jgi:indolepyruvate decarboxylase
MPTLGQHITDRLHRAGIKHGFHVPGDYTLPLYKHFRNSPIELIGTTSELNAGYAADAYARVNGIGLAMFTYCVGGFSILNAVAQAEAEKSPVVFLSGSPGLKERQEGMLLHHMVRSFECQHKVFSNVTCANTVLRDANRAAFEIDRVLEALKTYKRPVYIEIPRDLIDKPISYALDQGTPKPATSDEEVLVEVLDDVVEYINAARSPVILAGEEIARFGLQDQLRKLAEKTGIPVATSLLGKSVFNERHPLALGVYAGGMSKEEVAKVVDQSDCLIILGVMQTDVNMGFMPLKIGKRKVVLVTSESCQIRNSFYKDVVFSEFVNGLLVSNIRTRQTVPLIEDREPAPFVVNENAKLTVARFFEKIDTVLDEKTAIIADVGESLFGATDLTVPKAMQFLSPAFYTSMGFAVPGTLGVMSARPDLRTLVFVGDGAFQMTGMEVSTLVRRGLTPIIFVLNNQGYSTERLLLDGPWNDIQNWSHENIPSVIGGGKGFVVETEGDLDGVLTEALASKELCIVNVKLAKADISPALNRFANKIKKRV